MKMRASELSSAAVLPDGSLTVGFRSATDGHTLELSRKAQEQLLPALLASEPTNLHKFFTAADVEAQAVAEGVLLSFPLRGGIAIRVLVPEPGCHKLLALMTGWARRGETAPGNQPPTNDSPPGAAEGAAPASQNAAPEGEDSASAGLSPEQ